MCKDHEQVPGAKQALVTKKHGVKNKMILAEDEDGWPLLPDASPMEEGKEKTTRLQALVRAFVMENYWLDTGGTQKTVPWVQVVEQPLAFLDLRYLPALIEQFREPSRMKAVEAEACLAHWRSRQASGPSSKIFHFCKVLFRNALISATYDSSLLEDIDNLAFNAVEIPTPMIQQGPLGKSTMARRLTKKGGYRRLQKDDRLHSSSPMTQVADRTKTRPHRGPRAGPVRLQTIPESHNESALSDDTIESADSDRPKVDTNVIDEEHVKDAPVLRPSTLKRWVLSPEPPVLPKKCVYKRSTDGDWFEAGPDASQYAKRVCQDADRIRCIRATSLFGNSTRVVDDNNHETGGPLIRRGPSREEPSPVWQGS